MKTPSWSTIQSMISRVWLSSRPVFWDPLTNLNAVSVPLKYAPRRRTPFPPAVCFVALEDPASQRTGYQMLRTRWAIEMYPQRGENRG